MIFCDSWPTALVMNALNNSVLLQTYRAHVSHRTPLQVPPGTHAAHTPQQTDPTLTAVLRGEEMQVA